MRSNNNDEIENYSKDVVFRYMTEFMREEYSYHFTRHDGDTKVVKRKEVKTLIEP